MVGHQAHRADYQRGRLRGLKRGAEGWWPATLQALGASGRLSFPTAMPACTTSSPWTSWSSWTPKRVDAVQVGGRVRGRPFPGQGQARSPIPTRSINGSRRTKGKFRHRRPGDQRRRRHRQRHRRSGEHGIPCVQPPRRWTWICNPTAWAGIRRSTASPRLSGT